MSTPTVSARDFFNTLNEVADDLGRQAEVAEDPTALYFQKQAVTTAIDLWDHFSKAGGWAPGETLTDAYRNFRDAIERNRAMTTGDEQAGYALVLDHLGRAGVEF